MTHPDTLTDPADAPVLKRLRARGTWEGRQRTRLTVRDFPPFATGEPERVGGDNSAPTPMELVLAALDGCLAVVIETVAVELGIEVQAIELESEATIDVRGFRGVAGVSPHFDRVATRIELRSDADPTGLAALREATVARCPALNLVRDAGAEVELEWVTAS